MHFRTSRRFVSKMWTRQSLRVLSRIGAVLRRTREQWAAGREELHSARRFGSKDSPEVDQIKGLAFVPLRELAVDQGAWRRQVSSAR